MTTSIHAHIWDKDPSKEEIDMDFELFDAQINQEDDDYLQFGCHLPDGRWVEVRLPANWLKSEVLQQMLVGS